MREYADNLHTNSVRLVTVIREMAVSVALQ